MNSRADTLLLFGATGDLAQRMLLPSLCALHKDALLDPELRIIGTARTAMSDAEFRNFAREALENLSYRERRVLELRYGLGGEHPRTLDEVGRTFNVTRERIRQIENQSLKKLQSLAEAQKLRDVA